ncbi:unnamed protein product [Lymnaea stagnalis]|uniref:PARP n=1 Tax=Lymnaea stagnalis TaxID=6523 RepID=A0AAV2IEJ1_LYMST
MASKKKKKEYFPFNGAINGKSKFPLPGRDDRSESIEIFNIDVENKKSLVSEYKDSNKGYILCYHGTTSENAKAIVNSGINVTKGKSKTDFGQGFYVAENFDYSRDYVKQSSKEYTVLVFKLNQTFWIEQGNSFYDFDLKEDVDKNWEQYVAYNRCIVTSGRLNKKSNIKPLLSQLECKSFIRGHVGAKNLERRPRTSNQTIAKDPTIQVCIKTNEGAQRFFRFLYAAFSYNDSL